MKINKKLQTINCYKRTARSIQYIVIHWVGAESTALNNAIYFANGYRGASAHYFVDETSIWQSVADKNIAWAVGSNGFLDQGSPYAKYGHKFWQKCTNSNSISIEMCCHKKNGKWYIADETIKNTAWLVKKLMKKYNVPASRVIRHFDVNGKLCPLPYIEESKWKKLKKRLTGSTASTTTTSPKKETTWKVGETYSVVVNEGLNVRTGPGTENSKIGAIAKGKKVTPLKVSGNWLQIEYKKQKGWICGKEGNRVYVR